MTTDEAIVMGAIGPATEGHTSAEVMETTGLDEPRVHAAIRALALDGWITRHRDRANRAWVQTRQGRLWSDSWRGRATLDVPAAARG